MKKLLSSMLALVAVAGFVASAQAQDAKPGDKAAGATKVSLCIGCHNIPRYQSSFPEVYKVPQIAGQNAKYIASALTAYRKGDRKQPTMRAIAGSLSDQDIADVAAFYEDLGKGGEPVPAKLDLQPSADVAKLLAQANCASCHGANFNSPIDPTYPKIAGQYADYLYAALKAYQTDHNPQVGRGNPVMMGMARPFTHSELKVLSSYLASLPTELKTVQQSRFR
ncbi:MAG: c-type cytochrome [Pseudomonadota bacterium]|nr:c-type cytochrome [Pseudomonadota bacterium]